MNTGFRHQKFISSICSSESCPATILMRELVSDVVWYIVLDNVHTVLWNKIFYAMEGFRNFSYKVDLRQFLN